MDKKEAARLIVLITEYGHAEFCRGVQCTRWMEMDGTPEREPDDKKSQALLKLVADQLKLIFS